ncbi:MAG: PAS domain S-box protein [Bacteroidota bacterium]
MESSALINQSSFNLLKASLDQINEPIAWFDQEGYCHFANQALCQLVEKPDHRLILLSGLFPNNFPQYNLHDLSQLSEVPHRNFLLSAGRDRYFDVSVNIHPLPGTLPMLFQFVVSIPLAIMQQKQADRIREKSESIVYEMALRYKALFDQTYDALLIVECDSGQMVDFNEKANSLFFYSPEELIRLNIADLLTDPAQPMRAWLGGEKIQECELKKKNGHAFVAEVSFTRMYPPDDHICFFVVKDLTQQKNIEAKIHQSHSKNKAFFEALPAMFFHKDTRNNILDLNRKAAETLGMSRDQLIGENVRSIHPDMADLYHRDDLEVIESGSPKNGILEKFRLPDGNYIWGRTEKIPYFNDTGEVEGVMVFTFDVTDLQKAKKKLEEKNQQLKKYIESNLQLENFAYIASHDLREPLRTIGQFSQLITKRYWDQLDQSGQEFLNFINAGVEKMNRLINDLLLFSRVNTRELTVEELPTEALLRQVVNSLATAIYESEAQIRWQNLPVQVLANQTKIAQLFQNLISNAIKFRRKDSTPDIFIKGEDRGQYWQFSVQDNGIGISPDYFEKIFLIFKKLHSKDLYPGTGIGLALCKLIVDQHGGEIWVESVPGKGTTFHFTLAKMPDLKRKTITEQDRVEAMNILQNLIEPPEEVHE